MARPVAYIEMRKKGWRACTHCDGIGGPVVIDGIEHVFDRESNSPTLRSATLWRWLCSCGATGHWQGERTYPYHSWLKHLDRERMRR